MTDEPTYLFDEATAIRLRLMAKHFQTAIDELLARARVEPIEAYDVGTGETAFWEIEAELRAPQSDERLLY